MIVVDDHLLLDVLAGTTSASADEVLGDSDLATTLSCYFRLGRAVSPGAIRGSLSRRVAELSGARRNALQVGLGRPPECIAVVDARGLVPVMVAVADATRANLLTADAVATALVLEASIAVTVTSELMDEASAVAHVEVRLVR